MKDDLLLKYMVESFDHSHRQRAKTQKKAGPFITISRDHGCGANSFAQHLKAELEKRGMHWHILNKEIIKSAANKLNMDPRQVMQISESTERGVIDEVLQALTTRYYKSDRRVMQTIGSVVRSAAAEGNAIIVGRGGSAFTHGMHNGIHVKLFAPLEWRLQSMMDRYHATRSFMLREINATDLKRHKLMEEALKGIEAGTELYDLHINVSTVKVQELAELIIAFMHARFNMKERIFGENNIADVQR